MSYQWDEVKQQAVRVPYDTDRVVDEACVCGHYLSEHKSRGLCEYCKSDCKAFRFVAFILASDVEPAKQ
jgi:hypothetical protein